MMKVFLLKRKLLTVLACALAAAAIFCAVHYPAAVSAAAADRQLPIYCVQRDQKMVAISSCKRISQVCNLYKWKAGKSFTGGSIK